MTPQWMVVGLGNPGQRYAETRHNIGFCVIDRLSQRYAIRITENRSDINHGRGTFKGITVVLAKPLLYMNNSGLPVTRLAHAFEIKPNRILVIHDDLDLEFGRLKIKEKGGHGGHKGIASIIDELDLNDFVRLRIGIGRSQRNEAVADFVLDSFNDDERKHVAAILNAACKAVETILADGAKAAMNVLNRHRSVLSQNF